ncbi:helix-turn-helix domain-containing protein [Bacillus sp. SG-1]|uniref:helix-turn-helix domain-containing protein n=1 Tax=Bacillus sp. SG-1 TaxID=161544 RepID=UPI000694BD6E|nr:helix-turn-helix transcriptional regulator [Bacillus sp. SG-1]
MITIKLEELLKQSFGKVIRAHRKYKGLSQEELAHRSGFHHNHLNNIELGKAGMSHHTVFKVAAGLNVTPSQLLKEIEEDVFPLYKEDVKSRT